MSTRAIIGDIHLSGFQSDTLDSDGMPKRLGYIMKSLNFIIDQCRKRFIFDVDIAGDIVNDKSIIFTVAQDAFKNFLSKNRDINFVIISGNHDMSATGELQKSAISVFSEYSNVTCVIDGPLVRDNITYVPFQENFLETISKISPTDILISHVGLSEAMLQSGISKVDRITLKDISKFKLALFGHYHKPQELGNDKVKVAYIGSLIPKDWNDKLEQKRFIIYNTETLEIESIPIECGIPQFKEYIIEDISKKDEIFKLAEIARNNGHSVRIRNKTSEKIKEEVSGGVLVIESTEVDITNRGINITMSTEEQLKKYMEIKNIPENERSFYMDVISKYSLLKSEGAEIN